MGVGELAFLGDEFVFFFFFLGAEKTLMEKDNMEWQYLASQKYKEERSVN